MIYFKFDSLFYNQKGTLKEKIKRTFWQQVKYIINKKIDALLKKCFDSNPDFGDKIEDVVLWYLEYDDVNYNESLREIGLDVHNNIIVKMPDERNYGFWLDTNCTIEDFEEDFGIQMITKEEFEELWDSVYYDINAGEFKPMEQSQVLNQS